MKKIPILLLAGTLAASVMPAYAATAVNTMVLSPEQKNETKARITRSVAAGEPLASVITGMVKTGIPVDEVVSAAIAAGVDPAAAVSASIAGGHSARLVVRGALRGGAPVNDVVRAALVAGGDRRLVQQGARDAGIDAPAIANAVVKTDVAPAGPRSAEAAAKSAGKAETTPALVIPSSPVAIGGGGGATPSASPYAP
jgi:hypothetical protein